MILPLHVDLKDAPVLVLGGGPRASRWIYPLIESGAKLRVCATVLDFDVDAFGAGIEAVFDQLLEHRRRAFDDLTGGDLVNELLGQYADRHQELVALVRKRDIIARKRVLH